MIRKPNFKLNWKYALGVQSKISAQSINQTNQRFRHYAQLPQKTQA